MVTQNVRVEFLPDAQIAARVLRKGGDVDGSMKARSEKIAKTARTLAPKASGSLARSIKVRRPRTLTGQFDLGYQVVAEAPHALYVHEGRRAGARMPPAEPIRRWARLKGIPEERVFIIRRSIGRKGIKARPFLRDAMRRVGV